MLLMAIFAPWAAAQKELPYEYGFENNNYQTEGWKGQSFSGSISTNAAHTGTYGLSVSYGDNRRFYSPLLSNSSGLTLSFYFKEGIQNNYGCVSFQVGYTTVDEVDSYYYTWETVVTSTYNWQEYSVTWDVENIKHIGIKTSGNNGNNLFLDDFVISAPTSCPAPTDVIASGVSQTSATITWDVDGETTNFQYVLSTTALDEAGLAEATPTDITAKTITFDGNLTQNTPYYFYVRTNCGGEEGTSDWASCNFTTLAQFPAPTNFEATATAHTAALTWDAMENATGYNVSYSENDDLSNPINTYNSINATSQALSGLTASHTYYAGVQTIYAEGVSTWETVSFTTTSGIDIPTGLTASNPTSYSMDLSWTDVSTNDNHASYEVCYNTANSVPTELTEGTNYKLGIVGTTTTITGLESNTTYYFFVRDNCGIDGTSEWSASASESTTCGAESLPYSYDFETADKMECWGKENFVSGTGLTISQYSTDGHNNSHGYFTFKWKANSDQCLISPELSGTENGVKVEFYYKNSNANNPETFKVGYSTIQNPSSSDFSFDDPITINTSVWTKFSSIYPDGTKHIAIMHISDDKYYLYIDDISLTVPPTCIEPNALAKSEVRSNSATFSWTKGGNESNWTLQYATNSAFTEGLVEVTTGFVVEGSNVSYHATGLAANQTYYVRVKATCSETDASEFCEAINFTTLAVLPPTSLTVDNITTSTARLNWTGVTTNDNHANYEVYYSTSSTAPVGTPETGDNYIANITNAYYDLTGLTAGTTYYAWVRDICDVASTWTAFGSFTTGYLVDLSTSFTEGFDNNGTSLPLGWSKDAHWSINTTYKHDGYGAAYSGYSGTCTLTTPSIEISNEVGYVQLSFWSDTKWPDDFGSGSNKVFLVGTPNDLLWNDENHDDQWRQHTIDLSAYKGRTIQLAFEYTKSGSGHAWAVDDVAVTAYDKAFTNTGDWNVANNWTPAGIPAATDNVVINSACTIPANCIATANNITVAEGGSLTIADGGQLVTNTAVTATVQKHIEKHSENDGWYFISSSVATDVTPSEENGIIAPTAKNYDLYYYDEPAHYWRNYKEVGMYSGFNIAPKKGYLYANGEENGTVLSFTGTLQPGNVNVEKTLEFNTAEDAVLAGWNLVGNPFTFNVTLDMPCYTISGNAINTEPYAEGSYTVAPCEGVMVMATGENQSVTFSKASQQAPQPNQLQMTVAQQVMTRGIATSTVNDKAIVNFNAGSPLEKFVFNADAAKLYIPQNGKDYAIVSTQGQGEIPVNFKAASDGQYTITVNPEGVEMNYLHLIDNMTGANVDLLASPNYTFTATTHDYESRFRLVFASINGDADGDNETFAFFSNDLLIVTNEGEATLQVVDMTGHILSSQTLHDTESVNVKVSAGVYVIRLINGNDVKTQKIVVR